MKTGALDISTPKIVTFFKKVMKLLSFGGERDWERGV